MQVAEFTTIANLNAAHAHLIDQASLAELLALREEINARLRQRGGHRGIVRRTKFGWECLRVGQQREIVGTPRELATARQSAHQYGLTHGVRFTCRAVGSAMRVIRVA